MLYLLVTFLEVNCRLYYFLDNIISWVDWQRESGDLDASLAAMRVYG